MIADLELYEEELHTYETNKITTQLSITDEESVFSVEDLKDLAKDYLKLFFVDKKNHKGEKIKDEVLYTDRNICMVLNLDICRGMSVIYKALKPIYASTLVERKSKVGEDVKFVLTLLRECSNRFIPKCFAAGLVAVYVEVCKNGKVEV